MKHYVYSQELESEILETNDYQPQIMLKTIIAHLKSHPDDSLEHQRELSVEEKKKFCGAIVIDIYEINPKNGLPCKLIIKGSKVIYKPLTEEV